MTSDATAVAKPFLPRGSRTYRISPRVPVRYRAVVGRAHVTRSLGTRDYAEAKRRAHAVMLGLYAEWDALIGVAPWADVLPVRIPSAVLRPPGQEDSATRPGPAGAPPLSDVLDSYIKERGAGLSDERADILRAVVRDLKEVCGDKAISAFTRADAGRFKDVLLCLPANLTKRRELRGLPLVAAAERAETLGLPRQSAKTLKKKWGILSGLFRHAALNHDGVENPFQSAALAVSDGVTDADQWDPFTAEELSALLNSSLPGELHWLTWLGLCTGARANELCQLRADLVRQYGDIHYIHLPPTIRLKRAASVRSVPIHPVLIDRGFMSYVKEANGGPLFPDLTVHKSGRMSDATGKAFSRHLVALGIKRARLSFNSLRHNFKAAWDRTHPSASEARERLIGHALKGLSGRYGQSYHAESLDMVLLTSRAKLLVQVQMLPQP